MRDCAVFIYRFIIFAVFHSLFAVPRIKRLINKGIAKEPRYYRLTYNLVSFVMFGWVMAACRNSPELYRVPGIWSLVMYLFQLIVAVILIECLRQTGTAEFIGINRIRSREPAAPHLVTSGFYAITRHPLYFFSTLFLVLNPVMTTQWLLLTILSIIYFICGALIEEQRLAEQFGDVYRHYQKNTPFMMPKFKQRLSV